MHTTLAKYCAIRTASARGHVDEQVIAPDLIGNIDWRFDRPAARTGRRGLLRWQMPFTGWPK